jgi:hypothetical protein
MTGGALLLPLAFFVLLFLYWLITGQGHKIVEFWNHVVHGNSLPRP